MRFLLISIWKVLSWPDQNALFTALKEEPADGDCSLPGIL